MYIYCLKIHEMFLKNCYKFRNSLKKGNNVNLPNNSIVLFRTKINS